LTDEETSAAIAGASMKFSVMADGTPRAVIDFDPKDADAAYKMLGKPGQPVAVVALKTGFAVAGEIKGTAAKVDPRGPLCMEAINLCKNPAFDKWARMNHGPDPKNEPDVAKAFLLEKCFITSRKELDTDLVAQRAFFGLRHEFLRWVRENKT
jgi:hypothetical protein